MNSNTNFACQNCGSTYPKWCGQCQSCIALNTVVKEVTSKPKKWKNKIVSISTKQEPVLINEIDVMESERVITQINEFDRVLGGGLVPGAIVLMGGEPGIGKSTLLLQLCLTAKYKTLYVSGEESLKQIKLRADRLNSSTNKCLILTETNSQKIISNINIVNPQVLIIDSIQTVHSDLIDPIPGSISQIKQVAAELITYAKQSSISVILVGHITKDGNIAGPKLLEHMVDTVLQFEGDRNFMYRLLRCKKNRFGSTSEIGIFEMKQNGLQEIVNPSKILLSNTPLPLSGTTITATVEGMRILLAEVQALVCNATYGTPQRSSNGYNVKRLNMLLAILEKRGGIPLGSKDVFLNITGGLTIEDPATDLAIVVAILSSYYDKTISHQNCFIAEVGLTGEIRPVQKVEQRIKEVEKLGFKTVFTANQITKSVKSRINNIQLNTIGDALRILKDIT